jgi:hypothetical protein
MTTSRLRGLGLSARYARGGRVQRTCVLAGVAAALSLSTGGDGRAWGAPGSAAGSGAPTSGASASAAPSSGALAAQAAPVKGADLPTDPSPAPAASEWVGARSVTVSHGAVPPCRFELLREWLRIVCDGAPGAGLVAGDSKSVRVWSLEAETDAKLKSGVELPLRRGQSFIVGFLGTAPGYSASSTAEGPLVQIGWREGTPDPIIIAFLPR